MRWKYDSSDPEQYRCCFCFHVRTGTVLLGLFHMFVHVLALSVFLFMLLHPELAGEYQRQYIYPYDTDVVQQRNESAAAIYTNYWDRDWNNEDMFLAFVITLGSFIMAAMLVYGSLKGRSSYVMPFFCLQVFDFCITCLTVVGYFSYITDVKRWIASQNDLLLRDELLKLDADVLMMLAILFFVAVILVKSYLIGMVWACYQYLQSYEQQVARGFTLHYDQQDAEASDMLLPPKYEDAISMCNEAATTGPAPPAYSA